MNVKVSEQSQADLRVVLIRGLGRDQLHWGPLKSALDKQGLIIETPDLPGAGVLCREKAPLDLDEYCRILESQLSESELPTIVVGLSLGGMIALQWSMLRPTLFEHVIAINSSCNLSPVYWRLKVYRAWRTPGILARWNIRLKERSVYQLTCNRQPMNAELLDQWVNIQQQHPVSMITQLRQVIAAWRFSPPDADALPHLTFINSNSDRLVDPRCSLTLARHYSAPLRTHDWAGHDLPQDDPKWVAQEILQVCDKIRSSKKVALEKLM